MKQHIFINFSQLRKMEIYLMAKKVMDKKALKKKARKDIEDKIGAALADLKGDLGEKKFRAGLKKASKLFLAKLKKPAPVKPKQKTKLSAKKLSAVVSEPVK